MIEFSKAPLSSRTLITPATVESFCPIATYILMTPVPFWFRIVSIRIAVLPVCLSPIINSRWPRPIGIMESIAFMPVCNGSTTGCLSTTFGAEFSTGEDFSETIGPLPSRGWPSAFTTLPSNPSPTGTSTTLPVVFTVSPSLISLSDPSKTHPTLSSSRLRAIPKVPPGNSNNSFDMQSSSP